MDSSSEGSFAWTDASDDTSDNEMMHKTISIQSGEESESGKIYKKKLQKRLFSDCKEDKDTQAKKRKLSQCASSMENGETPKKKTIKIEPESDMDIKKKSKLSVNNSLNTSNDSYEESYLDQKVKHEQNFIVPTPVKAKRKKKNKNLSITDDDLCDSTNTQSHSSLQLHSEDSPWPLEEETINGKDVQKTKKKKSKSKVRDLENSAIEDIPVQENCIAEEIGVEQYAVSPADDKGDGDAQAILTISTNNTRRGNSQSETKMTKPNNQERLTNGDVSDSHKSQNDSCIVSDKHSKSKSRLSDRITFEDENDSNDDTIVPTTISTNSKNTKNSVKTSKLQYFVNSNNILLRSFNPDQASAQIVTDDDDVWLVRCPTELKVQGFQDKKWILDNKCKIKLDSQTYEGGLEEKKTNIIIVSSKKRKVFLKNLSINGCVRLHRRIPKTHIQHDNMVINNQTNFVPLPDTKCRHPLLGVHYKKALKLASSVAERLKEAHNIAFSTDKRNQKIDKSIEHFEDDTTLTAKVEPSAEFHELTQTISTSKKKKRKKRKQSEPTEDCSAPRPKKRKYDPKSAETWDSEKAIEETLFNF